MGRLRIKYIGKGIQGIEVGKIVGIGLQFRILIRYGLVEIGSQRVYLGLSSIAARSIYAPFIPLLSSAHELLDCLALVDSDAFTSRLSRPRVPIHRQPHVD